MTLAGGIVAGGMTFLPFLVRLEPEFIVAVAGLVKRGASRGSTAEPTNVSATVPARRRG